MILRNNPILEMGFLFYLLNSTLFLSFHLNHILINKPTAPIKSKKPLRSKGLSYDSDWDRTRDLSPCHKVAIMF